jgi:hypothetical protein
MPEGTAVADEPKPAEEPVEGPVTGADPAADASETTGRPFARPAAEAVIPDAEVVEDRAEPARPPRRDPEPESQIPVQATLPPAPSPQRRSGAFLGFLLGGAIAAAGGFALARYVPDGWPVAGTADLTARVEAGSQRIAALEAEVAALAQRELPDPAPALAALRNEVEENLATLRAEVEKGLAALPAPDLAALTAEARGAADAALAGIESRLAGLEQRAGAAGSAVAGSVGAAADGAVAALQAELQSLKDALAAQQSAAGSGGASDELKALASETQAQIAAAAAEAEKLKSEAEAAGRAAMARAALARIRAALDSGEPYGAAVAELTETGHEVPAVLADAAATGIPSLTALQRSFPAAARAALDAGLRADMGESWTERAATFLRTQTGARALTPLEGNDPDAILSRAEAALAAGQLAPALAELAALPDAAKAPLADWIAQAEQREAASAAIAALTTAVDAE